MHQDLEDALHDLAQVLDRNFCGHPGAILLEVLVRKLLWEALEGFLYQDLVRRVRFSSGRLFCMQGSWHEDLAERYFFISLNEDLLQVPMKCCQKALQNLVQVLVRSS